MRKDFYLQSEWFVSRYWSRIKALIYSETRKSKTVEHIHSIFVSTYGILFFGTPHQGSSKANLVIFLQRMVATLPSKLVDTDSRLLDALAEGSETLQDITDNFQPKMKRFHVFFFWEQGKSDLGVMMDYVSSWLSCLLASLLFFSFLLITVSGCNGFLGSPHPGRYRTRRITSRPPEYVQVCGSNLSWIQPGCGNLETLRWWCA